MIRIFTLLLLIVTLTKIAKADFGNIYANAGSVDFVINGDAAAKLFSFSPLLSNSTNPIFNNATISNTLTSLKIKNLNINTYQTGTDNVDAVSFYYKLYPTAQAGQITRYTEIPLPISTYLNATNGSFQKKWAPQLGQHQVLEIINDVYPNTDYTIECYVLLKSGSNYVQLTLPGLGNFNNESNLGNINVLNPITPITNNTTFKASFRTSVVLSLNNIQNFTGRYTSNNIELLWALQNNNGLKNLLLQKSNNGINWLTLKQYTIDSTTQLNFLVTDNNAYNGLNLYRLTGYSVSGNESFSRIIRINVSIIDNSLQIYPNPVKDKITMLMNGIKKGKYDAFLYDATGARVFLEQFNYDGFEITKTFTIKNILSSGTYVLLIKNKQEFYKQTFLVNPN